MLVSVLVLRLGVFMHIKVYWCVSGYIRQLLAMSEGLLSICQFQLVTGNMAT